MVGGHGAGVAAKWGAPPPSGAVFRALAEKPVRHEIARRFCGQRARPGLDAPTSAVQPVPAPCGVDAPLPPHFRPAVVNAERLGMLRPD